MPPGFGTMNQVAIVTDSVADLPEQVVKELGITVIPLIVRFGDKTYRDGIDLTAADFYPKLADSQVFPTTSVPSPGGIAATLDKLAAKTDQIIILTVSARLSATNESFRQGIRLMQQKCRVKVIDTGTAIMAEGFAIMTAARIAQAGGQAPEIIAAVKKTILRTNFIAAFDTLEYLKRGGRIGRAQALMGSLLSIHPVITLNNGVVVPVTRLHSRAKTIDYLYRFAANYNEIDEMAIEDSGMNTDGDRLAARLDAVFPKENIYRTHTSPVIGAHTGPGILALTVKGNK
jgi:fatty acid kinase fatty acid binding subunit